MKTAINKKSLIQTLIIIVISVGMFAALSYLFYSQIHLTNNLYYSDLREHIRFAVQDRGYSALYRIMNVVYRIFNTENAIAFFESLIVVATWLGAGYLVTVLYKNKSYFEGLLIALPTTFVTGIYIPYIYEYFYRRQLVGQPYHNITYYGMRLFAVFAMIVFCKMFENYLQNIKWTHWVLVTVLLALSTSVKPSFFYGFALTLLIFLIIDFIKTKCKLNPFLKMVIIGLIVIPSLAVMAFQATKLYATSADEGGTSIALTFGANFFKLGKKQALLKTFCSLAFPTLVAVMNIKKLTRNEKFVYLMYLIQFSITFVCVEVGRRADHGNFYWGLYGGGFFLFLVSFSKYIEDLKNYKERNKVYLIVGGILMLAHIVSSVFYFIAIMQGKRYLM